LQLSALYHTSRHFQSSGGYINRTHNFGPGYFSTGYILSAKTINYYRNGK
jgi:hypothetical protein